MNYRLHYSGIIRFAGNQTIRVCQKPEVKNKQLFYFIVIDKDEYGAISNS